MNKAAIIKSFLEKNSASSYKSTVLAPLGWFLGISFSGLIGTIGFNAPQWILILISILVCCSFSLYAFSYLYCLFRDRDSLRSEWYSINKIAMEKGVFGDSEIGNLKIEFENEVNRLDNESSATNE